MSAYYFTLYYDLATQANGHRYKLQRALSLSNNFSLQNISTQAQCGGKAICGYCRVKVLAGLQYCNPPGPDEKAILSTDELKQGLRLACQLYCLNNISILIAVK